MEVVRYGMIGCGSIATRRHIPECVANPRSRLVAVADPAFERAQAMAEKHKVAAFKGHQRMLEEVPMDAVVICCPNALHAPITIDALKAGKHVLCEKPMATSRDDARAMIDAAREARRFLMIGHNQRLMPAHIKAKQILDSGRLGRVLAFRTSFKHPGPDLWAAPADDCWFFDRQAAGLGVIGDLGIHKIDLIRWLLGQEITEVSGLVSTLDKCGRDGQLIALDDNAFLHLKTSDGVIGTLEASWTNYGIEDNTTVIYARNGTLAIGTDPTCSIVVTFRNGEQELHRTGAMASNVRQVCSGVIDAFTDCILNNQPPGISGEEGARSLDIVLTALEASRPGLEAARL